MPLFTGSVWLLILGIAALAVLVMLFSLAALVRDRTAVVDLRARVLRLRKEYEAQTEEVVMEDDPALERLAIEQVDSRAAA